MSAGARREILTESTPGGVALFRSDLSEQLTLDWDEVFKLVGLLADESRKRKDMLERELARWVRQG